MNQLIQSFKTGELGLFEVPAPSCQNNGIVIKTSASLLSAGTEKMLVDIAKKSLIGKAQSRPDLVKQVFQKMKQEGIKNTLDKVLTKLDTPIPLGYSCAGTVMEIGYNISGISMGDRVACGGAGFANHSEYNYIPKNLFVRIPDIVEDIEASFVTVGAIALQGVRQTNPTLGENIVVIGLGLLGQLTVQLLKANGCRVLGVDLDQYKLDLALKLGADRVCHSSEIRLAAADFTSGHGADAVIIAASAKSDQLVYDAGEISRMKGRVIIVGLVGMNIPRDIYYKKELEVKLSMAYGPGRYDPQYEEHGIDYPFPYVRWTEQRNFGAFLQLVEQRKVTPKELITHIFDFNDALKAYDLIGGESKENYLGIVLKYNQDNKEGKPARLITLSPETTTRSGEINLGLIGAGNFASAITLPNLKRIKAYHFAGLCDNSTVIAHATGKKYGFRFITSDPAELLKSPDINTVIINTRHNTHSELVIKAIQNNKHVFVEKPLCINETELQKISETYMSRVTRHASPILMVGFNRRFSPLVKKMKEALGNSPCTMNYRINAGVIPLNSWIQDSMIGGGRIIGEVCHFIDTCSFLTGSLVKSVMASVIRKDDQSIPDEDNVSILLAYDNGSTATITYVAYGNKSMPKEYIEVFANGIAMQMNDFRKLTIFKGSRKQKYSSANQDKGFQAEFTAFAEAIKTGKPAIPFESLYNTTLATFKIREAIKTHSTIFLQ